MIRAAAGVAAAALLLLGQAPDPARARGGSRLIYRNAKAGIQLYLPKGWTRQVAAAYPGLLAAFAHPGGARLLVSTTARPPSETPRSVAQDTARALRRRGLIPRPLAALRLGHLPAVLLEADDRGGAYRLRQLFAKQGARLYVLTFWVPVARLAAYATDVNHILRTARFSR